jgi:hypothetical protein
VSFTFRTELVAENTIFGTQQAEWKDSEVSQFLKKIFGLSLLPAEVSNCFALEFLSNLPNDKRSGTVLRLPARKLY